MIMISKRKDNTVVSTTNIYCQLIDENYDLYSFNFEGEFAL